jgi:hypothetical protein
LRNSSRRPGTLRASITVEPPATLTPPGLIGIEEAAAARS